MRSSERPKVRAGARARTRLRSRMEQVYPASQMAADLAAAADREAAEAELAALMAEPVVVVTDGPATVTITPRRIGPRFDQSPEYERRALAAITDPEQRAMVASIGVAAYVADGVAAITAATERRMMIAEKVRGAR